MLDLNKFAIGSAQFGLNYGISNNRGKVPIEEVYKILDYALHKNITTIDTAKSYGDSEKVIGSYQNVRKFRIISKFTLIKEVEKQLMDTLKNLKMNYIYGYISHKFDDIMNNFDYWEKLLALKESKKVFKIGFSLYYPDELNFIFEKNLMFDLIQIPYNIFDRRFEKFFPLLKRKNIEIHVRSIFLQGLFFVLPDNLPSYFHKIKSKLFYLHTISKKYQITIKDILLYFVIKNPFIDKIIIGVDSLKQFKDNIKLQDISNLIEQINYDYFIENDENVIIPSNWRLK